MPPPPSVRSVTSADIYSVSAACPGDPAVLILDLRPSAAFRLSHLRLAYNAYMERGRILDGSKSSYAQPWSKDVWMGKHLMLYDSSPVDCLHPVASFLIQEGACKVASRVFPGGR